MKIRKISTALLASSGLLFTSAPVFAGPFGGVSGGVFTPAETSGVTPGAINMVSPSSTPATPSQGGNVGNSEIQGLGDHDSWVSQDILTEDPRALCSDVGLGNNTIATSTQSSSDQSSSSRNTASRASNGGGGGGASFLGIGVNGSGQSSSRQNSSNAQTNRQVESSADTFEASTVEVGRNCDAFVESAAARDMNYQDNITERYRINVGRRGQQVDNLLN